MVNILKGLQTRFDLVGVDQVVPQLTQILRLGDPLNVSVGQMVLDSICLQNG